MYAFPQFVERVIVGVAINQGPIRFLDAKPRVREQIRQGAVVGDQNQTFAGPIEPSDGKNSLVRWNQIDHPRPAARIVIRRHDTDRLVDDIVQTLRPRQRHAIHSDFLVNGINPRSELHDGLPIHFDPSGHDQLFALAPTRDPGRRQNFLQTLGGRLRLAPLFFHLRSFSGTPDVARRRPWPLEPDASTGG